MKVTVSGKFSDDVFDEAHRIVNVLRDALDALRLEQFETPLAFMVYFPVIASDDLKLPVSSHRSYSSKERAEFVNVEIRHDQWVQENTSGKRRLMMGGLQEAILGTNDTRIPEAARSLLTAHIQTHAPEWAAPAA